MTLVGDGPERPMLEARARSLGIMDRTWFAGSCEAIEDWFGQADAFLLSSRYEGLPAVLVEARVAGLPLIATDCSTSIDGLLDRRCDRLVPVGDERELAAAIRNFRPVALSSDLRDMRRRFLADEVAGYYASLFQGLLSQAARTRTRATWRLSDQRA